MGTYARIVFPRICDLLLGRPFVARHRQDLLTHTGGEILEIGFGTGLNLPHYPAHIRRITTIDPNQGMHRQARKRIARSSITVDARILRGEQLPFAEGSFDCVVSTFTLCSIEDVNRALAEVYRVLKPEGRFLFLEHGLSPDPRVRKWQHRLNRLEMWLADGCRLDRNIQELVAAVPFRSVALTEFELEQMPRTHGHMYRGIAVK